MNTDGEYTVYLFTFIYSIDIKYELEARTAIDFENIETPAAAIKLKIGEDKEENKLEATGR